jgi:hypothetical protein
MVIMPQQMLIMAQIMGQHVDRLLPPPARGNRLSNR